MIDPHYVLEWSRNIHNGEPVETVRERLPVLADEVSCSWGPGRLPWHMVFEYDTEWAQWKISFSSKDFPSARIDAERNDGTREAIPQSAPDQTAPQSKSSPTASSQPHHAAREGKSLSKAHSGQQISLFWDHWRLRKMPLQRSCSVAIEVEKEAARGGRSYGDAQATESPEVLPSHLLIPLP